MTKGEQARLTAWRWKVLQHAADEQNVARVCQHFGISQVFLQVETTAHGPWSGGAVRPTADAAPITARNLARRDSKDSLPTAAVPLRPRTNRRVPAPLSSDRGGTILGPPHSEAARDESSASQSKTSAL